MPDNAKQATPTHPLHAIGRRGMSDFGRGLARLMQVRGVGVRDLGRAAYCNLTLDLGEEGGWVVLRWGHGFITDSWGGEVPAGWADPGEDPAAAVMREIEEETGYRPALVRPMTGYNALSGISDMRFTAFVASGAERVGPPADHGESSRVEWVQLAEVPKLAGEGQIQDGPSLTALMYYLAVERQANELRAREQGNADE